MSRRARLAIGLSLAAFLAGLVLALVLGLGGDDSGAATTASAGATTTVERRDLVVREDVDGTLGYSDEQTVSAAAAGTVTGLPEAGAVLRPGRVLYRLDGKPIVLLDGEHVAWRRLAEGIDNGSDVRQLERNLVVLGYDHGHAIEVDGRFDVATRAAVERLQRKLGLEPTGALELGQVVFQDGVRRVGSVAATLGAPVAAGGEILETTSSRREVTMKLDPDQQSYVHVGEEVQVELPDGRLAEGTVRDVGKVAVAEKNADGSDGDPKIEVSISLAGYGSSLDQAPVTVKLATDVRKGVLAVPVTALTAVSGGGYALEVVQADGTTKVVPVETGTFADGYVEVSGTGIRAGLRVVEAPA
jgi:peptidoglycan hydrolase-like protein with peptidoglycan-binding domain